MRSAQPPRFSAWLLRQLGCSPNNDAIIGDLNEKFRAGQSRWWYRREVLAAITAGVRSQVAAHRLASAVGILVGWSSILLLTRLLEPVYLNLHRNDYLPMLYEPLPRNWFDATEVWSYIGRIGEPFDWLFVAFACLVCGCAGTAVALLYRRNSRVMLLAFLVSRCIVVLAGSCFFLVGTLYTPQYTMVFLKLIAANLLTLAAILIPAAFFANPPESDALQKAQN